MMKDLRCGHAFLRPHGRHGATGDFIRSLTSSELNKRESSHDLAAVFAKRQLSCFPEQECVSGWENTLHCQESDNQ